VCVCPIAAVCTVVEILNLKCIWSPSCPFSHMTLTVGLVYKLSYRYSTGNNSLSRKDFKILRYQCHDLDLSWSLEVTWPFNIHCVISFGCSTDINPLSSTVFTTWILYTSGWQSWAYGSHGRHWSPDQTIRYIRFPVGVPLEPKKFWDIKVQKHRGHVWSFQYVYLPSILSCLRDIECVLFQI